MVKGFVTHLTGRLLLLRKEKMKSNSWIYLIVLALLTWALVTPAYGGGLLESLSEAEMEEIQAGTTLVWTDDLSSDNGALYAGVVLWDEGPPKSQGPANYVSAERSQISVSSHTAVGGSGNVSILQTNAASNGANF